MQPRTTIYLDYAATSPLWPDVRAAMAPYLDERYANASSLYAAAREARKAIEEAREQWMSDLARHGRSAYRAIGLRTLRVQGRAGQTHT